MNDTNLNLAECIKGKSDFFTTTYYNICNGTEQIVHNGTADILLRGGLIGLLLVVVVCFAAILIREIF